MTKGFYHHHWGTRMVSVPQHQLYAEFKRSIHFDELDPKSPNANIVFMTYDYVDAPEKGVPGAKKLVMQNIVGTSHNSLMMAALYHTPPAKSEFCKRYLIVFDAHVGNSLPVSFLRRS